MLIISMLNIRMSCPEFSTDQSRVQIPAHGGGGGNLEMTHSQGFGDAAPALQLANNPITLDQDHSTPMELDSDNDRDS